MKLWASFLFVVLAACSLTPEMPGLPDRDQLPIGPNVDTAYENARARPDSAEANGELGIRVQQHRDLVNAEILYHRAFLLDPAAFRWLYYIGEAQASIDNYSAAVATLRHALTKNPDYVPARLKLAELLLRMGNFVEGKQLFEQLTKTKQGAAIAWYGLGRIFRKQGQLAPAADAFRHACSEFPAYGAAHYELGFTALQLGLDAEARRHFILSETYKTVIPPLADPLLARIRGKRTRAGDYVHQAYELEQQDQLAAARRVYLRALHIDSHDVEAQARLVLVLGRSGEPDEAEMHYRRAIDLDSDFADAYANYGLIELGQKRYQEAQTSFKQALAINPYQPDALASLGYLLERERQPRSAERYYRLAVKCRRNFRRAHLRLASLLINMRRYQEAFPELEAALAIEDAKTPRFLYEAATQYLRAGNRDRARECLQRARALATAYHQTKLLDEMDADRWPLR